MSTMYTDNIDKWRALSDIDYFTYFVKSWISFNAWYKNSYPNLKTDREAINEIKSSRKCSFRKKFLSLIDGNNEDSSYFKNNLANFHYCLLNNQIEYNEQKLHFVDFMVELDKSNLIQQEKYKKSSYYIKIELDRIDVKSVTATIKNSKNNTILNYSHNEYDLEHLKSKREFKDLTEPRKRKIEGLLKEANPKKKISLLTTSEQHLKIGEYKFIDNAELIYKATVEILYNLRNALFHGEIVPNKDTNKVYEAAYRLMRQLVMEL